MKKLNNIIILIVTLLFVFSGITIQAQTPINQWGLSGEYNTLWPILNDNTTPAGDASMGGDAMGGWRALQGMFSEMTISADSAVIVSGQIEFAGGAPTEAAYTPIRYALTYQDSSPTLQYALTDSATWSHKGNHFGYEFTPRDGAGTMANGGGGVGTVWLVNNGNWASTWSNNGYPIAKVNQAPRNAAMIESKYNFAISVQAIDDTTNEIRWYMVSTNNKYWFGGTVRDTAVTKKFNSIIIGVDQFEGTAVNVLAMQVDKGAPITVPEAPWEAYYIDQWGLSGEYNTNWPILNDSTTLVGDASMGGEVMSGWRALQGGFGQDITISTDKAIIVKGQIEFAGGAPTEAAYTPIRYALTYQDSNSTLQYALSDSATWSHKGNHFGYEFTPRDGAGTMANGGGGVGTVWLVNNGNWASTWSNNGYPIAKVNQAPRNAAMIEGKYNFAISVQAIDDTTNEIRWYMVSTNNKYWFGGTVRDTAVTKKFNSIIIGVDQFEGTAVNVLAMQVDKGAPITVPEAPWEAYYIDQWGLSGEYNTVWPILNDSTTLVGDASIGGDVTSGWRGLQGGFGQDVTISTDKAIIVKGQIEFAGGAPTEASYTPIRYALTYQDSNSTLQYALSDSATWSHKGNHFGYSFMPVTGTGTMSNGNGGVGTVWTINNGNWASTYSNNGGPLAKVKQAPRNAAMIEGKYNFAISVQAIDDTTNEIRWYMISTNNKYWFGGTVRGAATTKKFNSIIFGVNEFEGTAFNVLAMQVDKGTPITVPKAPWEDFYLDTWGIYGAANSGGWSLKPGELTGNVDFNGTAKPTGWAIVRADLGTVQLTPGEDIFVLKGKMTLDGGGFDGSASLRFGLFMGDAGTVAVDSALDSSNVWSGAGDKNSGYLFIPQQGSNGSVAWGSGNNGTYGRVNNGVWYDYAAATGTALGDLAPSASAGGAGTYDFSIGIAPMTDGSTNIRWILKKDGYYMEGNTDDVVPINTFNSFVMGLSDGATATSLHLTDVQATMASAQLPTAVEANKGLSSLPTSYSLSQNYPNPFNPTTTINFALPKTGDVSIVVYDVLGRKVASLVNGNLNAGYHTVNFDASSLSSGIYFYKLKAGDFTSIKKLMLLK